MTNYTVSVKSLPAQLVASVRDPNLDEFQSLDDGTTTRSTQKYFRTLYDHLEQHGQAVGTPFTIIGHPPVDEGSTLLDVEIIKAITRRVPESQSVRVYELSAVPIMACLEYRGPNNWQVIENQALPALYAWVEDNGFKVVGPIRQAITVMEETEEGLPCVLEWQVPIAQVQSNSNHLEGRFSVPRVDLWLPLVRPNVLVRQACRLLNPFGSSLRFFRLHDPLENATLG
jgi:effector-binding domain-containing protein